MPSMPASALLIVDMQKDFCAGGALPVARANQLIPILNLYADVFLQASQRLYAARVWHPPHSRQFLPAGGPWPVHAVRQTDGADFHPELKLPDDVLIISKGQREYDTGYSCFEGTTEDGVSFLEILQRGAIEELFIGGVTTDYSIRATVMDAHAHRVKVTVLLDAIRGLQQHADDVEDALREMEFAGASFATLQTIHARLGIPPR